MQESGERAAAIDQSRPGSFLQIHISPRQDFWAYCGPDGILRLTNAGKKQKAPSGCPVFLVWREWNRTTDPYRVKDSALTPELRANKVEV